MNEYDTLAALAKACKRIENTNLTAMFQDDAQRVAKFSHTAAGLHFDFSRTKLDAGTLELLIQFAEIRGIEGFIKRMRQGEKVNRSEGRAAGHMALRATPAQNQKWLGAKQADEIEAAKQQMIAFSRDVAEGNITGAGGRRISHIVHIGIGGSELGPKLVARSLHRAKATNVDVRFVANIDAAEINDALHGLDPAATLVFVVSKTFSTTETLANAEVARSWLAQHLGEDAVAGQMCAVTAHPDRAAQFGIAEQQIFEFSEWVGGRFSLWSTVGLSLASSLGETAWNDLLAGAGAMDRHLLQTPFAQNVPVISALINFWNLNFLSYRERAIIPYATRLALLPSWAQQLVMESNGKQVKTDNSPAEFIAAPVIFGDAGTNSQHAFFQALYQGPNPVPVDFIGIIADMEHNPAQHKTLLANMLGQASALMNGKTDTQNPQKSFSGDRPSTTILMDELSPFALGALLAFYEHETVVLAQLCQINPFDQWGVELGKQLAKQVEARMDGTTATTQDAATEAAINIINTGTTNNE
ncbi:Glucose-6-phosphate isomerase [hydrothermal vent metagenome]|uniref:glucose-6-phosphate isomerase n=1 Tax=hydrothermal vent metagenome TaxID=652676 RepID=A0A3B0R821_9ZZZZ